LPEPTKATAGACPDAILVTSTGVSAGVTDGLDVSASNITNGVNLGGNILLMAAGDIDADSLTVDTTDDLTITVTSGSAAEDLSIKQTGANDSSILISAEGTGTDAIALTAAAGTVNIDANLVEIDATNDMILQVTSSTGGEDLSIAQVGGNDSSILVSAAGTGTDAISLQATGGSIDVDAADDGARRVGLVEADRVIDAEREAGVSRALCEVSRRSVGRMRSDVGAREIGLPAVVIHDRAHALAIENWEPLRMLVGEFGREDVREVVAERETAAQSVERGPLLASRAEPPELAREPRRLAHLGANRHRD
jgi:hypothetical protein